MSLTLYNDRSPEYLNGRREAIKWAVTWLHERAAQMGDPIAVAILNAAAFNMGVDAKRRMAPPDPSGE